MTIKEAAELIGITKNKAKYHLKHPEPIECTVSESGQILLSDEAFEELKRRTTKEPPKTAEEPVKTDSEPLETDSKTTKEPPKTAEEPQEEPPKTDYRELYIAMLEEQIKEKDRQIRELHILLQTEQQKNLLPEPERGSDQEPKKKGFFGLFKRG